MFLSMQSLNGDSYQGAQVGANVQSQVGPPTRTVPDNAVQRAVRVLPVCWTEPSTEQPDSPQKSRLNLTFNWIFCSGWNILSAKIHPTPLLSSKVIGSNSKHFNLRECIWLWLELLGWYWVFGYVVLPFFPCIFILLSHLVIVCCCLPFYTLYNVVTQHTHLLCTKIHQK